jgi:hypothetical protein
MERESNVSVSFLLLKQANLLRHENQIRVVQEQEKKWLMPL